jgi:hypothetical protein
LRGGAAFAGGFGHQPFSSGTSPVQEGAECRLGPQEYLQPLVGYGPEMPHEFEQTPFSVFRPPHPRLQGWAEGISEQNEEQPAIKITEGGSGVLVGRVALRERV